MKDINIKYNIFIYHAEKDSNAYKMFEIYLRSNECIEGVYSCIPRHSAEGGEEPKEINKLNYSKSQTIIFFISSDSYSFQEEFLHSCENSSDKLHIAIAISDVSESGLLKLKNYILKHNYGTYAKIESNQENTAEFWSYITNEVDFLSKKNLIRHHFEKGQLELAKEVYATDNKSKITKAYYLIELINDRIELIDSKNIILQQDQKISSSRLTIKKLRNVIIFIAATLFCILTGIFFKIQNKKIRIENYDNNSGSTKQSKTPILTEIDYNIKNDIIEESELDLSPNTEEELSFNDRNSDNQSKKIDISEIDYSIREETEQNDKSILTQDRDIKISNFYKYPDLTTTLKFEKNKNIYLVQGGAYSTLKEAIEKVKRYKEININNNIYVFKTKENLHMYKVIVGEYYSVNKARERSRNIKNRYPSIEHLNEAFPISVDTLYAK